MKREIISLHNTWIKIICISQINESIWKHRKAISRIETALEEGKPVIILPLEQNLNDDSVRRLLEEYPDDFHVYKINNRDGVYLSVIGDDLSISNREGGKIIVEGMHKNIKSNVDIVLDSFAKEGITKGELLELEEKLRSEAVEIEKHQLDFKWNLYTVLIDLTFLVCMFILAWLKLIEIAQLAIAGLLLVILNMSMIVAKSYRTYSKRKTDWNKFGRRILRRNN